MDSLDTSAGFGETFGFRTRFLSLLGGFSLLLLLSWPILFSFDLWVMKDRSSFLNLDYLLEKHYRLGVDAFYAYGLLPVSIEHVLFKTFGRGYWPMIGCTVVAMVLTTLFWALFAGQFPRQKRLLWGLIALIPLLISVNPNFPYSLVVLSIEFALLFVLKDRLDLALACSVVGCFSVPSLPLVLAVLLVVCMVARWWMNTPRKPVYLVQQLVPGLLSYAAGFLGLGLFFGFPSIMVTAFPILGSRFYKANGMGKFSAFLSFLHPPGYGAKYYLAYYTSSPVTWFVLSTVILLVLGIFAFAELVRRRSFEPRRAVVLICCVLQVVFICFAYGNRGQHSIYEPVLAAGTLVAISLVQSAKVRNLVLVAFFAVGILGEVGQVYKTWSAWRTTRIAPDTAGLYAEPEFAAAWADILRLSGHHKVLMLSYASGVHHYFPDVHNPEVWFLYPGQLFPSDAQRMVDEMDRSEMIVEDLTSPAAIIEFDPDVRAHMAGMHEIGPVPFFRVWQRDAGLPAPNSSK